MLIKDKTFFSRVNFFAALSENIKIKIFLLEYYFLSLSLQADYTQSTAIKRVRL